MQKSCTMRFLRCSNYLCVQGYEVLLFFLLFYPLSEWKEGAKLCHQLLSDESTLIQFAQQLVALAQYYGFDGWLINIENPINVKKLFFLFLCYLSSFLA